MPCSYGGQQQHCLTFICATACDSNSKLAKPVTHCDLLHTSDCSPSRCYMCRIDQGWTQSIQRENKDDRKFLAIFMGMFSRSLTQKQLTQAPPRGCYTATRPPKEHKAFFAAVQFLWQHLAGEPPPCQVRCSQRHFFRNVWCVGGAAKNSLIPGLWEQNLPFAIENYPLIANFMIHMSTSQACHTGCNIEHKKH